MLSLCAADVMTTTLFNSLTFWNHINTYIHHNLIAGFLKKNNFLLSFVFIPIVYANQFFFAVDTLKLNRLKNNRITTVFANHLFEHLDTVFHLKTSGTWVDTCLPHCWCIHFGYHETIYCKIHDTIKPKDTLKRIARYCSPFCYCS